MKKKYLVIGLAVAAAVILTLLLVQKEASYTAVIGKTGKNLLYKDQLKIKYSKSFEIEYFDSAKIVRVYSPDKARTLIFQYLLLPEGKPVPAGYEKYQIIHTPIKSIITLSSIYIGFLESLGLLDKLIAVDDYKYVISPKANELIEAKKITEVGSTINLNIEKVFSLNPGLLLTYGNGNPEQDGHLKLIKNGIPVASSTSHLETNSLARAEWIKFVAVFFDKEKKAGEVFDSVVSRYNALKELVKNVKTRPTVFTDAMYGGKWSLPAGDSYAAGIISDAGANYIWKDNPATGSLKLDYEQVFEKANDADFWINVHYWKKISDVVREDPRNGKFKAYRTKNIYSNDALLNKSGGNDIWESGIINCDVILADLIKIFHPELLPQHNLKYYRKLTDN